MDSAPDLDEDLIARALAELADGDYQAQVWADRVPTVRSSLVACYAALFGESGLGGALDAGPVFAPSVDADLLRLRDLLESVDGRQPIDALLRDRDLVAARTVAAGILTQLGVTHVTKRGLAALDVPLELPPLSMATRVTLAAVLAVAVVVALIIVLRPGVVCAPRDDDGTVSAYSCR